MMVLPGVLAFNISASVAMDKDPTDREPGNTKMRGFTKTEEQQFLDSISEFLTRDVKAQNRSQEYTNDLYPRAERIDGTDKIPHWVCNP